MKRPLSIAVLGLALLAVPPLGGEPAFAAVERRAVVSCGGCWPAAFAFTPGGDLFYVHRFSGDIRFRNMDTGADRRWKRVGGLSTDGEQGLLGIAVDPSWPRDRWVYVYYTRSDPFQNRIARFRKRGDGSFQGQRLASIPAAGNHNGGVIHFGPDGLLYAVTGDAGDPARSQDTSDRGGKVLRMARNGDFPSGNPFGNHTFSFGHRNSFGFAFDPETGRLWQSENGPECDDEVNLARSGRNYGWGPASDCPGTTESGPSPIPPRATFNPVIAPTGAAFCRGCRLGARTGGAFIMGSYNDGRIRRLRLNGDRNDVADVAFLFDNGDGVLAVESGPGRRIYFSDANGIYRLVRP